VHYFMVENGLITTAGIVVGCAVCRGDRLLLSLQYQLPRLDPTTWSAASSCCGCWVNSPHGSRLVERRQCPHPWLPGPCIVASTPMTSLPNSTVLVIDDKRSRPNSLRRAAVDSRGAGVDGRLPRRRFEQAGQRGRGPRDPGHEFPPGATTGEEGVALFHTIRAKIPRRAPYPIDRVTHLETAVELVKAGAADYIAKPWDDARLLTTVRNLLDLRRAGPRRTHCEPNGARPATRWPPIRSVRHCVRERRDAHPGVYRHTYRPRRRTSTHHRTERRG